MKYIVLEVKDHTAQGPTYVREVPFIFPSFMVHADVAEVVTRVLRREQPDGRRREIKPISAGFINSPDISEEGPHGESETLGLKSRGLVDGKLITMYDYFHGIVE